MTAARKFNQRSKDAQWRSRAYAAININWKLISPDGDRDERLAWITEYLGLRESLTSLTDLTDDQLGAVAGEMKRLTGQSSQTAQRKYEKTHIPELSGNVVAGDFGRDRDEIRSQDHETIHLASTEQIYTIEKLMAHIGWGKAAKFNYLIQRHGAGTPKLLTFAKATKAVNALLHIAGHQDLKSRKGQGEKVSRDEVSKYIPLLKQQLKIDQR
ncbi:MAG TPA: hypothetical protein VGO43_09835 [Pyrinomonadaceae bacterium]|jgi:hypothetical protein|nr:hypothetical protein [Pyrinomonadaceae bacterium]